MSTNGVSAIIDVFFDGWTFGVLPLTYWNIPKSASAHLFPQSVEIHYFCSGPVGVDPICPQPNEGSAAGQSGARTGPLRKYGFWTSEGSTQA